MPEKRRRYDRDFREGAVGIVRETGKPIAQVARDLGINPGTLTNWVAKDKLARGEKLDSTKVDAEVVRQLEAKIAELTMERDVLKRSVVLWVKEADAMTVASFIASQRAEHAVPHVLSCRALDVSESWFYKWKDRAPTKRALRRQELDEAVKKFFDDSGGRYGSPKIHEDLIEDGWKVSQKSVADSMARQGLNARPKKKGRNLTRPDKAAKPTPDLVERDFSADDVDQKWCGDSTEIPTDEGKLYLATVEDLSSRRVPGLLDVRTSRRRGCHRSNPDGGSGPWW